MPGAVLPTVMLKRAAVRLASCDLGVGDVLAFIVGWAHTLPQQPRLLRGADTL